MPFFIGDYLRATMHLTTEQHGAYALLIFHYWCNGAPPDDDRALAAITRLPLATWKRSRPTLARFFQIDDGLWSHRRVESELAKAKKVSDARSASGRMGGRPSKNQTESKRKPKAKQNETPSQSQSGSEPINGSDTRRRNRPIKPDAERSPISPEEREEVGRLMKGLAADLRPRSQP